MARQAGRHNGWGRALARGARGIRILGAREQGMGPRGKASPECGGHPPWNRQ